MTLDEAIIHAKEKAEELRAQPFKERMDFEDVAACEECAEEHEQLAEWLEELKTLRKAYTMACEEIGNRDCDYYYYPNKCKSFCELYEVCAGNIEYEDYYLQKAREENETDN